MLPEVVEVILVQEAFAKTEPELGQANALRVVGEGEASLVRDAVVSAVDVKTIQVGITPTHGDLNGVMEVGGAVVAPQKQSAPDHRLMPRKATLGGMTAVDVLELVNA